MLSRIISIDQLVVAGLLLLLVAAVLCLLLRQRQTGWHGILAMQPLLWLGGSCLSAHEPPAPRPESSQSLPVSSPIAAQKTANKEAVGDLYVRSCVRCHGKDGKGKEARGDSPNIPDFTDHKWQEKRSDEQLTASILDGKGKEMPAFADKFGKERAQDLVAYIRQFDPDKAKPQTPPKDSEKQSLQVEQRPRPLSTPTKIPSPVPQDSASSFEMRFQQLEQELRALQKQFRDLQPPPQKP